MYKCTNNNECDNNYLCCRSCEKEPECTEKMQVCENVYAKDCPYIKCDEEIDFDYMRHAFTGD